MLESCRKSWETIAKKLLKRDRPRRRKTFLKQFCIWSTPEKRRPQYFDLSSPTSPLSPSPVAPLPSSGNSKPPNWFGLHSGTIWQGALAGPTPCVPTPTALEMLFHTTVKGSSPSLGHNFPQWTNVRRASSSITCEVLFFQKEMRPLRPRCFVFYNSKMSLLMWLFWSQLSA